MTSADEGNQLERLLAQYQRVEETLYGSVYPLRVDTSQVTGEILLGKWRSPFVVSKQLGQREIIYGSVLHHMHEAAGPIFRMESRQNELAKSLPSEIHASLIESRSGNQITFTSPASEFSPLLLYKQDEIIKDAVLLSALPVRTLVEVFSGKGNRIVPTYDYEGNRTNGVSMQQVFHALCHHRYCVVSGGFIHDIFSGDDVQGLPDLFGTTIKVEELLNEVIGFLEGVTVNDFVGMLRSRLEKLTIDSKARDIVFAHQNVYALADVVRGRAGDASFSPFSDYLFSRFTAEESRKIEAAGGKSTVILKRRFTLPRFAIGPDLDAKVIVMSININDKQESFEFSQQEFFDKLTAACGKESVIPIERLRQRIEDLADSG